MIRHIVLMKPRENVGESEVEAARSGLLALRERIPGIVDCRFGANDSPEGLSQGYEFAFTIDFADAGARDDYLPHPAHQAYIPAVRALASDVLVFDFEI